MNIVPEAMKQTVEAHVANEEKLREADCIEGETAPYAVDNADFDTCNWFRIRYGGVPPNVFVNKCAISPSPDAIRAVQIIPRFDYADVTFEKKAAWPLFMTFSEYCEKYESAKHVSEGRNHAMSYPPEFPGRTHEHHVGEPEILWTFFVNLKSALENSAPSAIPHFYPHYNHPSHLTYRTNQPDGVDWRPVLAQYYCHFHYAMRIARLEPYDHPGWSHHVPKDSWSKMSGPKNGHIGLLPHQRNLRFGNCSPDVPDTEMWKSFSDDYFGEAGTNARRNFIKTNRKAAAKYGDADLWVLRAKVGHRISCHRNNKEESLGKARNKGSQVADRYAEILEKDIADNDGELTVGMVFDAADDATLELRSYPYDGMARFEPDDRYTDANQDVKDPVNPWEKR